MGRGPGVLRSCVQTEPRRCTRARALGSIGRAGRAWLVRLLFAATASGCGPARVDLAGARVVLERAPAGLYAADFRPYRVEIQADGTFTFTCRGLDARERVEHGQVSSARLEALLRDALELRFFELAEAYVIGHSDGILEILELEHAGRSKAVRNYWFGGTEQSLRDDWGKEIPHERYLVHRGLSELALDVDEAVGTEARLARLIAEEPR